VEKKLGRPALTPLAQEQHAELVRSANKPDPEAGRRVDLDAAARAIDAFLTALGHAPEHNPELRNTGRAVAKAFHDELLAGHRFDAQAALASLMPHRGGDLVVVRDVTVTCVCPHHLLPATGVVHVGYIPGAHIVGFGALARLARGYASRLILQEALCEQISDALIRHVGAHGAGCIAQLAPGCLTVRGPCAFSASVVTSHVSGLLRDDPELRREFYTLAQLGPKHSHATQHQVRHAQDE